MPRGDAEHRRMATFIWVVIAAAVAVVWLLGIIDIIKRRLDAKHTAAWLLIVLLLPILGTILYWVLRDPDPGDLRRAEAAQSALRHQRHERPFDSSGFGV
jgi:hypothetical protein